MDSDRPALSYAHTMDHSIMQTDSSELTAAAALTSLVSGMGHNARPRLPPPAPTPDHNVHQAAPCKLEDDFEFPTQFTKSGRKKAVPFPVRLMKVLSLKQYEHIISWLPSGKSFKVHNSKLFTKEVLPLHFKSAKFSSFTRKLHRWGFMRNYRGEEEGAFFHDQFLRDRMDLASKMSCHSGPQDSPKSASGKKIQQRIQQDRAVPPPPPPPPPAMPPNHSMQPRMPPSHMPDASAAHQNQGYMNQLYGSHNGYLQGGPTEYPSTPQQRQLVRPIGTGMSPPARQPSIGHMSSSGPTAFSPDLNVAIEMEVSRRLEEIMSVSANLEVMKEQAKLTAINRLQSYPSPQQQQHQMQPKMGQQQQIPPPPPPPPPPPVPQQQQQQQQQQLASGQQQTEKPTMNPAMPSNPMPNPPQQQDQPSAVGAKTA